MHAENGIKFTAHNSMISNIWMDSILNSSNTPKYFNTANSRRKDLFPLNDTDPNRILSSAFNGKAEEE